MPQKQPNNSMISIERCKEILGEKMPDSEVERLRESLYAMVESIMDNYLNSYTEEQCNNSYKDVKIDICKKQ